MAGHGVAGHGVAGLGRRGMVRQGEERRVAVWMGESRSGKAGMVG